MTKLISISEAARQLRLHPTRVRLLCRQGRINATRVGSLWVIDEDELRRFARITRPSGRPPKR